MRINYTVRDFDGLKQELINYVKAYHPDKFTFFNDANPDMMYLELLAYIGDNLNYQLDKAFNENFRTTALARESLVRMSNDLSFYEFGPRASTTQVKLSIRVPFVIDQNQTPIPDPTLLIGLKGGTIATANNGTQFEIEEEINFADGFNRVIIPNFDSNNQLLDFTITKTAVAKAGISKIQRFYVSPDKSRPFLTITIDDEEVVDITGVVGIQGNITVAPPSFVFNDLESAYTQVLSLTQDKLFVNINPEDILDPNLKEDEIESAIKQGEWIDIPRRYIVRRDENNLVSLIFGSSQKNLSNFQQIIQTPINNTSFNLNQVLNNSSLGEIPSPDTTLFIKYRKGGGSITNVDINQITTISSKQYIPITTSVNLTKLQQVRNSLSITNEIPAVGGRDELTNEELRYTMDKVWASQKRAVTYPDVKYIIANMPPVFGQPYRISYEEIKPKVANLSQIRSNLDVYHNELITLTTQQSRQAKIQQINDYLDALENGAAWIPVGGTTPIQYSQLTQNLLTALPTLWIGEKCRLYIVGLNEFGQLTSAYKQNNIWVSQNQKLKENIRQYLLDKRIIGDWIDIVDGRIINMQVEATIIADPKNQQFTATECLKKLRSYFAVDNWNLGQSIFKANVQTALQEIEGVINVVDIKYYNIFGTDPISGRQYSDIESGRYRSLNLTPLNALNTKFEMLDYNNIITGYADSIFEVKYPDVDIIVNVK